MQDPASLDFATKPLQYEIEPERSKASGEAEKTLGDDLGDGDCPSSPGLRLGKASRYDRGHKK